MAQVLAIGRYGDSDAEIWRRDFDAALLPDLAAIAKMSDTARHQVRGLGYLGHAPLDGAVMDLLPQLRVIANFGVGFDAINVADATARGITVTNTPDVLNDDVADLAVGLLIAQSRDMVAADNWLRAGNWGVQGDFPISRKMSGRKVGVLGLGRIGREIADRLAAFKCQIHYFSRSQKDTPGWVWHADPTALAAAVDDLVIAVVGGPQTEGLVSAPVIAALGADGIVVNISRGSVIDETALLEALEQGRLRGAGLDVFRAEPKVDPRFLTLPNVTLLPHVGSATTETREQMGALQRRNLRAVLDGHAAETPVNQAQGR